MPLTVIITANARRDIQQVIDWENSRSPELGIRFLKDLSERLNVLATTPDIGSIRYLNVKCTRTFVFPYLIHYITDSAIQTITILRVLHTARKPDW